MDEQVSTIPHIVLKPNSLALLLHAVESFFYLDGPQTGPKKFVVENFATSILRMRNCVTY